VPFKKGEDPNSHPMSVFGIGSPSGDLLKYLSTKLTVTLFVSIKIFTRIFTG
jgi:hypothetical protein